MTLQAIKPILLAKGAETESLALIEAGLSNGENPKTPGDKGLTALMIAATQGFYEGVERLLPLSDPLAVDLGGETALMCAAQAVLNRNDPRRMQCIEALLPVSDPLAANNTGGTALMRAAHFGSSSAIKILLPHSDATAVDMNGRSALSLALASGSVASCEALLAASPIDTEPDFEPLAMAAGATAPEEAVQALLGEVERRFPSRGAAACADALFGAVSRSRHFLARSLAARVDWRSLRGYGGATILMAALERQAFDAEAAICAGFFAQGSMLEETDDHGQNALARLLGGGHLEAANWLIPRWPNWREAEALFKARALDGDWEDRMPGARAYFESREISKELNLSIGDPLPARVSRLLVAENELPQALTPTESQTTEAEPASKKKGSRRL